MESGFLLHRPLFHLKLYLSFYPCFNGIRVLTGKPTEYYKLNELVSILVLMESGFLRGKYEGR